MNYLLHIRLNFINLPIFISQNDSLSIDGMSSFSNELNLRPRYVLLFVKF